MMHDVLNMVDDNFCIKDSTSRRVADANGMEHGFFITDHRARIMVHKVPPMEDDLRQMDF
jgi:hypothetical protein